MSYLLDNELLDPNGLAFEASCKDLDLPWLNLDYEGGAVAPFNLTLQGYPSFCSG